MRPGRIVRERGRSPNSITSRSPASMRPGRIVRERDHANDAERLPPPASMRPDESSGKGGFNEARTNRPGKAGADRRARGEIRASMRPGRIVRERDTADTICQAWSAHANDAERLPPPASMRPGRIVRERGSHHKSFAVKEQATPFRAAPKNRATTRAVTSPSRP
jgi:hypothetical protein